MKRILFLLLTVICISCSSDNEGCEAAKEQIMEQYAEALENDNLTPTRRQAIIEERDKKIQEACN